MAEPPSVVAEGALSALPWVWAGMWLSAATVYQSAARVCRLEARALACRWAVPRLVCGLAFLPEALVYWSALQLAFRSAAGGCR